MCRFLFPSVVSSRVFLSTSMLPLVQGADGSEVVGQTTKQASFCVTLLLMTLLRERTFQEIIGRQWYWCMVVPSLDRVAAVWCPGSHLVTPAKTFLCFPRLWIILFIRGWKRERDKKKQSTWSSSVNSLHNCTVQCTSSPVRHPYMFDGSRREDPTYFSLH